MRSFRIVTKKFIVLDRKGVEKTFNSKKEAEEFEMGERIAVALMTTCMYDTEINAGVKAIQNRFHLRIKNPPRPKKQSIDNTARWQDSQDVYQYCYYYNQQHPNQKLKMIKFLQMYVEGKTGMRPGLKDAKDYVEEKFPGIHCL